MTIGVPVAPSNASSQRAFLSANALLITLVLFKLGMHLATNWRYGFHRDELYYIACGLHLAWGYVDHPPITPLLARVAVGMFGLSLPGLRLFSALAGAGIVLLAGLMARALGGGRFAQALAALAVIAAPLFMVTNTLFQTVPFDQLCWVLSAYLLIQLLKTGRPHIWLLLGVVIGIGLLTKHTMLFFAFGLGVALLLTPERRWLRTRWPWLAALIAGSLFLPNLLWQAANGWPTLEFLRNNNANVRADSSAIDFLLGQLILIGPLNVPIWIAGLSYAFSRRRQQYRLLGWIYLVVFVSLFALRGKPYYPGPAYPMLLAAGALQCEQWVRHSRRSWLRPALLTLVIVGGLVPVLAVLPILPPATFVRYGLYNVNKEYIELLGWDDFLAQMRAVYQQLTPEERARATLFTANYGEASAINLFGGLYGLPHAISGHNSYFLWGPGDATSDVVFAIGFTQQTTLTALFADVRQVATITNAYNAPNEELGAPIYICRKPKQTWQEVWGKVKHYS